MLMTKKHAKLTRVQIGHMVEFTFNYDNYDDKQHAKLTRVQIGHKVEFTFNYDKDLGRDIHFKRNG